MFNKPRFGGVFCFPGIIDSINIIVKIVKASSLEKPKFVFNNPSVSVIAENKNNAFGFKCDTLDVLKEGSSVSSGRNTAFVMSKKTDINNTLTLEDSTSDIIIYGNLDRDKAVLFATDLRFPAQMPTGVMNVWLTHIPNIQKNFDVVWTAFESKKSAYVLRFLNTRLVALTMEFGGDVYYLQENFKFEKTENFFGYIWNKEAGKLVFLIPGTSGSFISCPATKSNQLEVASTFKVNSFVPHKNPYEVGIATVLPKIDYSNRMDARWNKFAPSYTRNSKDVSDASIGGVETSYLTEINYRKATADEIPINVLQTKDILDGDYIQGRHSYALTSKTTDQISHRTYESIFVGNAGKAREKAILSYALSGFSLPVKAGKTTEFTIESNGAVFTKLNINDTTFVESGALAGKNPILSDKVYKKLSSYGLSGTFEGPETGTYLCTWLYENNGDPVWLDRFYHPLMRKDVDIVFEGPSQVQTAYEDEAMLNSEAVALLRSQGYFDVKSYMRFDINTQYKYSRIGIDTIQSYFSKFYGDKVFTNNSVSDPFTLVVTGKTEKIDSFTLSMSVDKTNWNKNDGSILMSAKNGDGFAIVGNLKRSGLFHLNQGDKVVIYDENFVEQNSIKAADLSPGATEFVYVYAYSQLDYFIGVLNNSTVVRFGINGDIKTKAYYNSSLGSIHSMFYDRTTDTLNVFTSTNYKVVLNWNTLVTATTQSVNGIRARVFANTHTTPTGTWSFVDLDVSGIWTNELTIKNGTSTIISLARLYNGDYAALCQKNRSKYLVIFDSNIKFKSKINVPSSSTYVEGFTDGIFVFGNTLTAVSFDGVVQNKGLVAKAANSGMSSSKWNHYLDLDAAVFEYQLTSYDTALTVARGVIPFNMKKFEMGVQNIAIDFNGRTGYVALYINGLLVQKNEFIPERFTFIGGFKEDIQIGKGGKFERNAFVYNTASATVFSPSIEATGISLLETISRGLDDIRITLPYTDSVRHTIEEISVVYKMGIPARKDNKIVVEIPEMDAIPEFDELLLKIEAALNIENPAMTEIEIRTI